MTAGAVNYAVSCFKYKSPTPIIRAPTNKTLKRLKQELWANASSVESDLGGRDHGHLGLVLNNPEYASVSAILFVSPEYPATLTTLNTATQVKALNLREDHKESKQSYYKCKSVEKVLQRHIQDAIKDKYLKTLVNEDTQLIQDDILTVLEYLFGLYGKVPSEEVKQKEAKIRAMSFHPADPLILLHNPIKKLNKLTNAASILYTRDQLLNIGLTVICNNRDF